MSLRDSAQLLNFGACAANKCYVVSERCEWNHCGVCCRALHLVAPRHTVAPALSFDNHFYTNPSRKREMEEKDKAIDLKPLPYPEEGEMVRVTEPEYPIESLNRGAAIDLSEWFGGT